MFKNSAGPLAQTSEPAAPFSAAATSESQMVSKSAVAIRPILMNAYAEWCDEARRKGLSFRAVSPDVMISTNAYWIGLIASRLIGDAIEHTHTGDVSLDFSRRDARWILTVQDSGVTRSPVTSDGLNLVKHAAALLGHLLTITSGCLGSIVKLQI